MIPAGDFQNFATTSRVSSLMLGGTTVGSPLGGAGVGVGVGSISGSGVDGAVGLLFGLTSMTTVSAGSGSNAGLLVLPLPGLPPGIIPPVLTGFGLLVPAASFRVGVTASDERGRVTSSSTLPVYAPSR